MADATSENQIYEEADDTNDLKDHDDFVIEDVEKDASNKDDPKIGMMFNSVEEAYTFYNDYGRRHGFSVRRKRTNASKLNKSIISAQTLCCYCEGQYKKVLTPMKRRDNRRFNCLAEFHINLSNGRYKLNRFIAEHTHPLEPPGRVHCLRSQRVIQPFQAEVMKKMHSSGIPQSKTFSYLAEEAGGDQYLNFIRYDCYNLLSKMRKEFLKKGDVQCLQEWFKEKKRANKHFFYSFMTNDDGEVRGVFFSDAKSRRDYGLFGDVLCFDTTFNTNKYNMVCAPIVGINNHGHTTIFGCGLLDGERTDSIVWLFNVFLEAMGGKRPETIFTDQSAAISNAIKVVFPEAHHRLCLWHLYQNAAKHLSVAFSKFKPLATRMKECIYEPESVLEFETSWMKMLEDFELVDNAWLKRVFEFREKWAQVYAHNYFCAGMTTTQRSESMNKFFKAFFGTTTILREFVAQYTKATSKRREKEKEAENRTLQTTPNPFSDWMVEYEASMIYTKKMFFVFQDELKKTVNLDLQVKGEDENMVELVASKLSDRGRDRTVIYVKAEQSVFCSCRKFEFHGILCSHAILVFHRYLKVTNLPARYYLKRWTRAITEEVVLDSFGEAIPNDIDPLATSRYSELSYIVQRVVSKGAMSTRKFSITKKLLLDIEAVLQALGINDDDEQLNICRATTTILDDTLVGDQNLRNPKGKRLKGQSKERNKPALEKVSRKKHVSYKRKSDQIGTQDIIGSSNGLNLDKATQLEFMHPPINTTFIPASQSGDVIQQSCNTSQSMNREDGLFSGSHESQGARRSLFQIEKLSLFPNPSSF